MHAFQQAVAERFGREFPDYLALHRWSVESTETFWQVYAEWARIPFASPAVRVKSDEPMPLTKWFEGATLNYAEALLYPTEAVSPERTAIIAVDERGVERRLSYRALREEVARCAAALRRDGVGEGDRVAALTANIPEAVVLLLACASLGAVFSSCSPDFGFEAAYARFGQIAPKLLFASPGYIYNAKRFEILDTAKRLAREIESYPNLVLLPDPEAADVGGLHWEVWLERETAFSATPLPFDHPLYILYSSGTTGLPKAMVHRAGGVLLAHHREHRLHGDIRPGDVVMYFTTCGWMMWNWLVSVLAQGATIVLYEGSPSHPTLARLWQLAAELGVTHFGTSARFIHSCKAADISLGALDLTALRTIFSTGSPLSPAGFAWVYERVKADVHLASISGGTDIVSCFMGGVPTLPVYAGQIQGPGLGVDLAVFDETGKPVEQGPGELVCLQPLPSMPLGFWNDPDFTRYREAYFSVYPGVWRHGDLIEVTPQGGIVVYGRSDATLNPGGVRIGTAEIYRPLEHLPEVVEALAVGKRQDGDEEIWLFVVLAAGVALDEALIGRIKQAIREGASPRHVPKRVFQVSQLPRTRSGKATEIAVAKLVNGQAVPNREVMANPEALDEIARAIA
jgi:acetoacetyl-CoA synthetase